MPAPAPTPAPAALITRKGAASVAVMPAIPARGAAARKGDPLDDPWVRGVALATSMHHSMVVTQFGDPDYARLVEFMQKPRTAVLMTFSNDPHLGMVDTAFTGSAIVFQATVTFEGQRTAGLQ
jgi:hypothetical protein